MENCGIMNYFNLFIKCFSSLFAIVNPIGAVLVFVSLISKFNQKKQIELAKKSIILAFCLTLFFAIFGDNILELMGANINSLRVAGGILLFMIGYNMISGSNSEDTTSNSNNENLWVFPIAIPLLCGPGAISTVVVQMGTTISIIEKIIVLFSIFFVYIISFIILYYSKKISLFLGENGCMIVTRLLGLFLSAMAIGMISEGIHGIYYSLFLNIIFFI